MLFDTHPDAENCPSPAVAYRCPGQSHPISQAVHLGRLAAFYPACRLCPHRDETGTLSPRQVERLREVRSSVKPTTPFHDEGAGGVYLNDFTPAAARQIAAAFAAIRREEEAGGGGRGAGEEVGSRHGLVASEKVPGQQVSTAHSLLPTAHCRLPTAHSANPQPLIPDLAILLAADGRPITAELTAAVGEGLRWTGCNVVDIGPATAACLAFAVHHLQASGGILVGNPGNQPHRVGLQFWAAGPRPLSAGGSLEPLVERCQAGAAHSARRHGQLQRFQAEAPYLEALSQHFHALRPLRIIVDSASGPLVEYLRKLIAPVACQVVCSRVARRDLPEQVRTDAAHLAVCIDGDGETCSVLDEQGRVIPTERLLLLLARRTPHAPREAEEVVPVPPIVLEPSTPTSIAGQIEQLGLRVVTGGPRRAEMAAAMTQHRALLGGGPSGRFWHADAGVPLPDALMTVTRLLVLLSRSDDPFSAVLDREAPTG